MHPSKLLHPFGYDLAPYPWEPWYDLRRHTLAIFDHHRINCVLDVGACKGQYATLLRQFGYKGRIVSFEPVPKQFAKLEKLSAADPLWEVHNLALGSSEGELPFHVMASGEFSSFLEPDPNAAEFNRAKNTVTETILVKVKRMDSIFDECVSGVLEPSVFLKMDTQGYDLEVIRGASVCLSNVCAMQSEVSVHRLYQNMPNVTEFLSSVLPLGFGIVGFVQVTKFPGEPAAIEFDCLLSRVSLSEHNRLSDKHSSTVAG
jgi:FkbM family methyltransferase